LHERSRIGRLKDRVVGGGNLPHYSITELDGRFQRRHFHNLADSPLNGSGMAHHVTSFDNHVLSLSDRVYQQLVFNAWCGFLTSGIPSFTERWMEMTGKLRGPK